MENVSLRIWWNVPIVLYYRTIRFEEFDRVLIYQIKFDRKHQVVVVGNNCKKKSEKTHR